MQLLILLSTVHSWGLLLRFLVRLRVTLGRTSRLAELLGGPDIMVIGGQVLLGLAMAQTRLPGAAVVRGTRGGLRSTSRMDS